MNLSFNDNNKIKYYGRVLVKDSIFAYNTCSGIELNYTGTYLKLTLDKDNKQYLRIYIDNIDKGVLLTEESLIINKTKDLEAHQIKILRTNSNDVGKILEIKEIDTDGSFNDLNMKTKLKIEFYGDSLTCGFMINDDKTGDTITNEDGTYSFAYLLSNELDADFSMISRSGISISLPYWVDYLMKDRFIYYSLNNPKEKWDFTKFIPDYVIINLGTNDSASTDNKKGTKEEFIIGYTYFLKELRKYYNNAKILCTYGICTVKEPIKDGILESISSLNDDNIKALIMNPVETMIDNGHPTKNGYIDAKNQIIEYIKRNF